MLEAMTDLNIITPTIQAVLKTNEQIAKEKKAEYMRNYMKEYKKKNVELDEVAKQKKAELDEVAKKKKAEYMRNYMKEYNKKRMETDEAYREYRRQMSRANNKKMYQKYVKALNYTKENNINV
jgi:hypothetical protein